MNRYKILGTIEPEAAKYLLEVAEALAKISGAVSYGQFYVSEAVISFDGDESGYRVIPNDGAGYDIAIVASEQSA